MKRQNLVHGAAAIALVAATASHVNAQELADKAQPPASATVTDQSVGGATAEDQAQLGTLVDEAVSALVETQAAINAIDSDKIQEAIDALARATGKLEIILTREPNLALVPAANSVIAHDVLTAPEDVKALADRIEDLIDKGRLQEARRLMEGLASEIVISTSNLPMGTYPDAIKRAAALLYEQKAEEAKRVLLNALNTIVVTEAIIPLPIVRAAASVEAARAIAAKESRTQEDKQAIAAELQKAREQIELAQAFGYATKKELDDLLDAIKELERETSGGSAATRFFERIRGLFANARESSQPAEN
jgi:hypothetical protein